MFQTGGRHKKAGYLLAFLFCLGQPAFSALKATQSAVDKDDAAISSYHELLIARKNADFLKKEAVLAQQESRSFLLKVVPVATDIQKLQSQINREKLVLSHIERQRQEQQLKLARQRKPLTKLAAALERMARYPIAMTFIQPDNISDIIHLREIIAASRPVIQQRSSAVLEKIAFINSLYQNRMQMIAQIQKDQKILEEKRQYFLSFAHSDQEKAENWLSQAMYQEDAAIAAEQTLKDRESKKGRNSLKKVICPFPITSWSIPVKGWISRNSDEEVLYLTVDKNTEVVAPQSGIILYAGDFRSYQKVVIIRHKDGYISLLTGLAKIAVADNQAVREKQVIGYTSDRASEIGFQLRRNEETVALWPDIKEASQQNGRSACNFLADLAQENNTKEKIP